MPNTMHSSFADREVPRQVLWEQKSYIAGPSYESFTANFGHSFPKPSFLESSLGRTAVYDIPPPSKQSKRPVLILHGSNTPALGLLALVKELQALDPDTHVALLDFWGHGLSSTPLTPHTPQTFHLQIFQVLGFLGWSKVHLVGYSFGGMVAISFAIQNQRMPLSVTALGPAGLLRKADFPPRVRELLDDSTGREKEAKDAMMDLLEGGPLEVPGDWRDRLDEGQVAAKALRAWGLQEHAGYPLSILSLLREGDVADREDIIQQFAQLPLTKLVITGELDFVSSPQRLAEQGLDNIEVIPEAGHDFVRSAPGEVARIMHRFWTSEG